MTTPWQMQLSHATRMVTLYLCELYPNPKNETYIEELRTAQKDDGLEYEPWCLDLHYQQNIWTKLNRETQVVTLQQCQRYLSPKNEIDTEVQRTQKDQCLQRNYLICFFVYAVSTKGTDINNTELYNNSNVNSIQILGSYIWRTNSSAKNTSVLAIVTSKQLNNFKKITTNNAIGNWPHPFAIIITSYADNRSHSHSRCKLNAHELKSMRTLVHVTSRNQLEWMQTIVILAQCWLKRSPRMRTKDALSGGTQCARFLYPCHTLLYCSVRIFCTHLTPYYIVPHDWLFAVIPYLLWRYAKQCGIMEMAGRERQG